jgi:DNA invertase Pin-like site-specific DNA recombinase
LEKNEQKKIRSERGWSNKGIHYFKEREFEVIFILSNEFPVKELCRIMGINRSSFYKWKERMEKPSQRMIKRISDIKLFSEYHDRYPNHGY